MAQGTFFAVSQPIDRGSPLLISEVTARSRNMDLAYYLLSKQLHAGAILTNGDPLTGEVGGGALPTPIISCLRLSMSL